MESRKPKRKRPAAPRPESKARNERVLHTRVPAVLEEELRRLAESVRVPVSNLVRTILEDALGAAEAVGEAAEEELRGVADRLARERAHLRDRAVAGALSLRATAPRAGTGPRPAAAPPDTRARTPAAGTTAPPAPAGTGPLAGVLGYQPLVLAVGTRCTGCSRPLAAGTQAFLGLRETPGPRVIVGAECVPGPKRRGVKR